LNLHLVPLFGIGRFLFKPEYFHLYFYGCPG
jgi:hypothetical protein